MNAMGCILASAKDEAAIAIETHFSAWYVSQMVLMSLHSFAMQGSLSA